MTTPKVVADSIEFLNTLREYGYSRDRIISMDETGLWSNVVQGRTYHYRGGYVSQLFLFLIGFCISLKKYSFSYFVLLTSSSYFLLSKALIGKGQCGSGHRR